MTIVFSKILAQKYSNKALLVPNLGIFIISRYFAIAQFQGADTKYNNSFFLILAQKHPNKAFLVPNLGIFVFPQNFAIRQI